MRTATANFTTANVHPLKPIVIVKFDNAIKFTNGSFVSIPSDYQKYLLSFDATLPKIDLLRGGQQSFGSILFQIADNDGDILGNITIGFLGDLITAKLGFQSIVEADFISLPDQKIIDKPRLEGDLITWSFVSDDARRLLGGKQIFRQPPRDEISGTGFDKTNVTAVPVGDATVFVNPANLPDQWPTDEATALVGAYVAVGSEIVFYDTVNTVPTPDELQLNSATSGSERRRFFTERSAHNDGEDVIQFYCFHGMTPCDALLYILLTGGGHAYYDLELFDSAFDNLGFGLTANDVNITNIERIGWQFFPLVQTNCNSLGSEKVQDGLQWIMDNILIPAGLYLFVNSNGKIDVDVIHPYRKITEFSSVKAFDDDHIVRVNSLEILYDKIITSMTLQFSVNPLSGQHVRETAMTVTTASTLYPREDPYVIKTALLRGCDLRAPGICTAGAGADLPANRIGAMHMWTLYTNPPAILDFRVMPDQWLAEPPDNVTITHGKLPFAAVEPEALGGSIGWTNVQAIIIEQSMRPLSSEFSYKAFVPGYERQFDALYDAVYTTIPQGSLTDSTLSFSATNSNVTEAADAYVNLSGTHLSREEFVIVVTVTEPNGTVGGHGYFKLGFWWVDSTGPTTKFNFNTPAIRYSTDGNQSYDLKFHFHHGISIVGYNRFKIDYFERNKTGGDEAGLAFKSFATSDKAVTITEA